MGYGLLAFAAEDDADGKEHDFQVEQQGHILHIDDVAIEALDHFLHRVGITHADRTPAGQSRANLVEQAVLGRLGHDLLDEIRTFGPRTDDGHVATEDVP